MNPDTRNKTIAAVVFALLVGWMVYSGFFAGGTTNPAPAAAVAGSAAPVSVSANANSDQSAAVPSAGNAGQRSGAGSGSVARAVAGSSAGLDPTLHMEAMLVSEQVEYSGTGRNIFSPNSMPPAVKIPALVAPARPVQQQTLAQRPAMPAGPPPIDITFFGTETDARGNRQAILLHDDTVYTAQAGDIVLRRYRILSIDAKSLEVEDLQNNNRQTLPLLAN